MCIFLSCLANVFSYASIAVPVSVATDETSSSGTHWLAQGNLQLWK